MTNGFNELGDLVKLVVRGYSAFPFPDQENTSYHGIDSLGYEYCDNTNEAGPPNQSPDENDGKD
jgi:hypothetical protein